MSLLRGFEQRRMDVEVATYLHISHVSNHEIFRKELTFFKVVQDGFLRKRRAQAHTFGYLSFESLSGRSEDVLRPIITGDETWIQYYDEETKRHDME